MLISRYREFVPTKQARRTQAERTEATTTALVDAARELFAQDGYAATSLDAVAAKARVTKGAVYHHFEGKQQLFEAVFAREVERLAAVLPAVYASKRIPGMRSRPAAERSWRNVSSRGCSGSCFSTRWPRWGGRECAAWRRRCWK